MTASMNSLKAESTSRHHRKAATRPLLVLHSLCLLFSLTSVSVFSASVPLWNANLFHSTGPISGDWSDMLPLIPLGVTVIFNLFTLATLFLIPAMQGTHSKPLPQPSAKTRFLLTSSIILTLAPLLVAAGLTGVFRFWRAGVPSQSRLANGQTGHAVIICNLMNIFAKECEPMLYRIGELQIGGLVAGVLSWISVFGLWLLYCKAWQRERRRAARRRVKGHKGSGGGGGGSSSSSSSRNASDLSVSSTSGHGKSSRSHGGSSSSSHTGDRHHRHHDRHHGRSHRQHRSKTHGTTVETSDLQPLVPPPLVTSQTRQSRRQEQQPHHKSPTEAHKHLFNSLSRSSRSKYYIPTLPLSRTRDGAGYQKSHHDNWHHDVSQNGDIGTDRIGNGGAIEEVRRKMKPRETINSWLAHRYV